MNDILLVLSLLVVYSSILLAFKFYGRNGLFAANVLWTILANIEVLIIIDAFGIRQTLGNVPFASTFLITDILSELYGRKDAHKAVLAGIAASVCFLIVSQIWISFTPSSSDWAMPAMKSIFGFTPRVIVASLVVYAISQFFDVWLYHKWWDFTTKISGNNKSYLWIRNNGSTMISQLVNTVLYTLLSFGGVYDKGTLLSIMASSYIIYFIICIIDTPIIYLARNIKPKE